MDHSLPPAPVLQSLIDTFFFFSVHDRSYACVKQASFMQAFEEGRLPDYLLLAVLACAVQLTEPDCERTRQQEMGAYASESWTLVSTNHLKAFENPAVEFPVVENPRIEIIQTLSLLAVFDYRTGCVSAACLKIGLAAQTCQTLRLMVEPLSFLSFTEQEERRRIFWTIYIQDRLMACGKSRSLPFQVHECMLQLPCDEEIFRAGEWQSMHTLIDLWTWNFQSDESLNSSGLVVLMVSVLGRCTKYKHWQGHRNRIPPWDSNSEFSEITSLLPRVESYFQQCSLSVVQTMRNSTSTSRSDAAYTVLARILFHLCHCLINHPFVLLQRSKPFTSRLASVDFTRRHLDTATYHARQLLDLLDAACTAGGYPGQSSYFPYWTVIAGGILSIVSHFEASTPGTEASDAQEYITRSFKALERLGSIWHYTLNMAARLREFHDNHAHGFAILLNPEYSSGEMDSATEHALWAILDHEIVGTDLSLPGDSCKSCLPDSPSCTSWDINSDGSSCSNSIGSRATCTY
ncbi:fungal-specific transcription factor domain-containing protein [Aspergillus varians]